MTSFIASVLFALLSILLCVGLLMTLRRGQGGNRQAEEFHARLMREAQEELERGIADQFMRNRSELAEQLRTVRMELASTLREAWREQSDRIERLTGTTDVRLRELRDRVDARLSLLQEENARKLEEMRLTVDERLQSTLEKRLGDSFRLVSERLEQVHQGLGEMQALASGVGDLKRILTNVKTRGNWGEVQLSQLLEQVLAPGQYGQNVAVVPGRSERVEYAIRLPGKGDGETVWLPIDAKFPQEDYQRLLDAYELADMKAAEDAGRALEARVRDEAKAIREKYIEVPHTTDFAILFVPTEGLYAEMVRRPGLIDKLQREHRVVIAGPTTLLALLNSLQMGFRTLAIEQRSSEVWRVLGAVKTEFGKFGETLEKVKRRIEQASSEFDTVSRRTRAITRQLRDVEVLPESDAASVLDLSDEEEGTRAAQ